MSYAPTIDTYARLAATKAAGLRQSPLGFFTGAMLAGTYIGIAMILALSTGAGLPAGVRPLVMGGTFGIGLILTVFAGADLFTGYVMYLGFGLARRTITLSEAIQMIVVVWVGNLVGGVILSLVFAAGGGGAIFANANAMFHAYVAHKVEASALALLARAILCNWLVCLAIWTAARMQGDAAKCIAMAWILLAFVAAGFEHSVANMTGLTLGLLVDHPSISIAGMVRNLAIVSIGNAIGALVFVCGGYLAAARTDVVAIAK
ncbi:nitrite transporter NirC [Sphingomonas sp. PvP055]|uniref:formate/nitrite transporter family protein n=1 Tax=Sphingomonas sp. PvP055 TaxID=3156391 RepID=UPI0033965564